MSDFATGDRVSWDRGDLPDGEGEVVELDVATPSAALPEGWLHVRDVLGNRFMFPPEKLTLVTT